MTSRKRVGIVGFGSLGHFLAQKIVQDEKVREKLEIAFVWNRTREKIESCEFIEKSLILDDLKDFAKFNADIIVEVAHPQITRDFGALFLASASFFLGSPTALADAELEKSLLGACNAESNKKFGLYVPSGALWGANDIQKMAQRGTLKGLNIRMAKHPSSLKVQGDLIQKLEEASKIDDKEVILYSGPVRQLAPMAPNNVNTMAAAALAGLGFDETHAELVSDKRLEAHVIDIKVIGPTNATTKEAFECTTRRYNPAAVGAVTGQATYVSFLSSLLLAAEGIGNGIHFC